MSTAHWTHDGRTSTTFASAPTADAPRSVDGSGTGGASADPGAPHRSADSGLEAGAASVTTPRRASFRAWRRSRPFVGGLLTVVGGLELFFSGQLDLGNIRVQFGIEGLQATVIPLALVVLGVLVVLSPAQRVFYGIVALALSIYSLLGVNLGGFVLGMLLGAIGSVLVVAWVDPSNREDDRKAGRRSGRRDRGGARG